MKYKRRKIIGAIKLKQDHKIAVKFVRRMIKQAGKKLSAYHPNDIDKAATTLIVLHAAGKFKVDWR